jgi:hypothetical protein
MQSLYVKGYRSPVDEALVQSEAPQNLTFSYTSLLCQLGLDVHILSIGPSPCGRPLPLLDRMIFFSSPIDLVLPPGLLPSALIICELKALWIGKNQPGPMTMELAALYEERVDLCPL